MLSYNLTELTLCGLKYDKEECEYAVSFKRLKVLHLANCRVKKFNYFWSSCCSTLEKLSLFCSDIKEEYEYKFEKLNDFTCEYPMSNIKIANVKKKKIGKAVFGEFLRRNPLIKSLTTRNHMDDNMLKDIHMSNVVYYTHSFYDARTVQSFRFNNRIVPIDSWKLQTFNVTIFESAVEYVEKVIDFIICLALNNVKKIIAKDFHGHDLVEIMLKKIFPKTEFAFINAKRLIYTQRRYENNLGSLDILEKIKKIVLKRVGKDVFDMENLK